MKIPPDFQGIKEPIQFLQIFYKHLHYGIPSAEGGPVKKSVKKYLWSIGQIFMDMGEDEPP